MNPHSRIRYVVLLLFFASGLSALIYQVIWLRSLATLFGSTVYATTTVLASFMGGLALGSYFFGKRADRIKRPLMLYGILEIGIGVFALLFPLLLNVWDNVYVVLHQNVSLSFYVLSLVRFVTCSLILIVPTAMMGGTFPLINKYYIKRYSHITANVSLLYGINTFGAVSGVILAGFILMQRIGIFKTSLVAISINIAVGILAVLISLKDSDEPFTKKTKAKKPSSSPGTAAGPAAAGHLYPPRLILAAAFLSGLAALSYEVIWTRTLIFILDSFTYSFSIMLSTFLVGITIGSFIIARAATRIKHGYSLLCVLFILVGVFSLATLTFFSDLSIWKENYLDSLSRNITLDTPAPWVNYILFKFLISAIIMLIPAIMMGAAFPIAIKLYTASLKDIGERIGRIYAVNTVGAIIGSFMAGFVLISFLGLKNALVATAGISWLTGLLLLFGNYSLGTRTRLISIVAAIAVFGAGFAAIPGDVYERIFQRAQKTFELAYYKEDPTATVTVHKRCDRVIININGLNVAGTGYNFLTTQKMQAHLGLLLHPNPQRVMQIGFGSGGTCYSVSQHPSVTTIDCVEICQGVIDAAHYFLPSNHSIINNPIVDVTIEDARNYVLATPQTYDLILSDSIHPTYAGNGTLYSKDYFALCKKKLNRNGFVSFWLPTYLLSQKDYKTIIKTFQSEFPYVSIWYVNSAIEAYTIVLGRTEPFTIDLARLKSRLRIPGVAQDLASVNVFNEDDVLSYFIMGPNKAREYASDGDINSDDYPIIELRAPKSMSRRITWYKNLRDLLEWREYPFPFITNSGLSEDEAAEFTTKIQTIYTATDALIQGQLINISSYQFNDEYSRYAEANRLWPQQPALERLLALARSRTEILLGQELLRKKQYQEAQRHFDQAIAVNPDPCDDSVGQAHFMKALAYSRLKKNSDMKAALERCLRVSPNHKQALILSVRLALTHSDLTEAARIIERLRALYPHDDDIQELQKQIPANA